MMMSREAVVEGGGPPPDGTMFALGATFFVVGCVAIAALAYWRKARKLNWYAHLPSVSTRLPAFAPFPGTRRTWWRSPSRKSGNDTSSSSGRPNGTSSAVGRRCAAATRPTRTTPTSPRRRAGPPLSTPTRPTPSSQVPPRRCEFHFCGSSFCGQEEVVSGPQKSSPFLISD